MIESKNVSLVGAAALSFVMIGSLEAQPSGSGDAFTGVWKVNIERSVYPGPRPPADRMTLHQFTPLPDGSTRFMLTSMNDAGDLTIQVSIFRVDGQQYPVHTVATLTELLASGEPTGLTRSYRQVDPNTVEFTGYTDGAPEAPVIRQLLPGGDAYVQRPVNGQGAVLLLERVR